ncbi:MAG: UDP-N-acetylmuramoyl-L-alanine--D-glutamate ligase [Syntrophales bacterium]|jgi:UDP-N-acetylmuramoylalanine--D-glutamate ligase|nr:UDP-N-acetylmuramoyl-L-alanine--D-glutamate ligase [Syntrophales bacterium]MCK9528616.1 UDP-N-acetylmuramoyl-L-alanine--D-glutamate ligase [Syntrophales bacterium]MDX9923057.1 UDP-N-acetylmuramoyl-L-alanine--D-glutamate ligase [Syntrophales bacterium]
MKLSLGGKQVLVYGLGTTGIAVARFLAGRGARVHAIDDRPLEELSHAAASLKDYPLTVEYAPGTPSLPPGTELVIPSPGVPPANLVLQEAEAKGIPVISEIELAFAFIERPIVAVTGTNGKTTATELAGHMLKLWGQEVFLGGNLGTPLISCAGNDGGFDVLVVEVSSFQLQWVRDFRPRIAVLLNVGTDHLDYHGSLDNYKDAKKRIFKNMGPGDPAILNADDPCSTELVESIAGPVILFSSKGILEEGIFVDGPNLRLRRHGFAEEVYFLEHVQLRGRHNRENIMASIVAARACECPREVIQEALESFQGLPHRIEEVGSWRGVRFFNDSKGTNVDAVMRALEAFEEPLVLLMGGRDKKDDFSRLEEPLREKVRELILFGEAGPGIAGMLGGIVSTSVEKTLDAAVDRALVSARPGDVVLLSPGCASFDEFVDYRERGDFFKKKLIAAMESMGETKQGQQ